MKFLHRRVAIGVGAGLVLAAGGTGVAMAVGNSGDDGEGTPLSAATAAKAKAAALTVTGGGTVTALERDGENGATYEVELTKPDGRSVDVRLNDAFKLVGQPEPNGDAVDDERTSNHERSDDDGGKADRAESERRQRSVRPCRSRREWE